MNISFGTKITSTAQNAILKKVDDGEIVTKKDYSTIEDICSYKQGQEDEPTLNYEEHDGFLKKEKEEDHDSNFKGAFFLERPGYKTTKFLSENLPTLTQIKRAEDNIFIEKVNGFKRIVKNVLIPRNPETKPFYDEAFEKLDIGISLSRYPDMKQEQKTKKEASHDKKLHLPMPDLREKVQQLFSQVFIGPNPIVKAPINSNPDNDHDYFNKMFK